MYECPLLRMSPIDFDGGHISSENTRGQRLKTLFTQNLKVGSIYLFNMWCMKCPLLSKRSLSSLEEVKFHLYHQRSNTENDVYTKSEGRKHGRF